MSKLAQLIECQTTNHKVMGLIPGVLSMFFVPEKTSTSVASGKSGQLKVMG